MSTEAHTRITRGQQLSDRHDRRRAPEDWKDQAVCATVDPELFFPNGDPAGRHLTTRAAITICKTCPVIGDCLAYALSIGESYGVWGGMTEDQREELRRRRRNLPT